MGRRETAAEIDDAAAAWAVRLDRAPLTPEEDAALDGWLAADIRRQGAFARAQAVMLHADRAQALGATYDPANFTTANENDAADRRPRPTRRWALAGGGAIAASLAVGVTGVALWRQAPRYHTDRGEVRLVPLSDGSVVTLNTATQVAVKFTGARRDIQLIDGEALFDVAKNPDRPFIVHAGDVRVRAIGTSFIVRKLPGQATQVVVREGVVQVTRGGGLVGAAPATARLIANQQAVAAPAAPITPSGLEPAAVDRALAWREGMLSFAGTSLGDAADEFARYSDPRIVVDDPSVAGETITGLFSANNPAGFAKAVALSLNLNAQTESGAIHLSR
jgi:transmembrane sensor